MSIVEAIGRWLRRLSRRSGDELNPDEAERLGTVFRERYHSFRRLLACNGRALEAMAALEQAYGGTGSYGMSFVVSNVTSVAVQVYQMVRHLDSLAPETYRELYGRFDQIRSELEAIIHPPPKRTSGPLVLPLTAVRRADSAIVGPKMANLGEIAAVVGLEVPRGFVITASAYNLLLDHNDLRPEIRRLIQATELDRPDKLFALSSELRQLITRAEVPPDVRAAVAEAIDETTGGRTSDVRFAVRSSGFGEDTSDTSFAGLYDSQLNIHPDNLLTAYLEVAASKYTPQAIVYRREHGLRNEDTEMAVGCVIMIDAAAGGVAYTTDPQDRSDARVHISAAIGLPKTVVDGRFPVDTFVVERPGKRIVRRDIAHKTIAFALRSGAGIARRKIDTDLADRPALDDRQIVEVAQRALALESHFGATQDVEWAVTPDGRLVVLQARPMHYPELPPPSPTIPGEPLLAGGVCVSPGVAGGRVSWVRSDRDALKMPDGAVLAVDHPDPRWAALLDRAAAVVAEHGGVAGHLATVAREYGVPAIFGVGPRLANLRRGDEVTVDADGCAIHEGIAPGVEAARDRRSLMDGSPIQTILSDALARISPLTLLDPASPDFRPANTKTLHDITRFCHEIAVREMFAFGKRHRFPRFAAKQLHHNVPMQWWVLNLDDGFTEEISGKYVRLEQISCAPMHTLWDGMTAIPWEGPPAISGSGFASVLFEATRNPALSTPFRKPYANRNYFMVSAGFMNLQSRFGFHFSTVETLAGERDSENYLVFSLKGGAADEERRVGRARLIAELLEPLGFRLKIIEDTVTARILALPRETILGLVRVVGYLLMHTRQLDVIMGDERMVQHYREKLGADIASILERDDKRR